MVTVGGEIVMTTDDNPLVANPNITMDRGSSMAAGSNITLRSGGGVALRTVTATNGDVRVNATNAVNIHNAVEALNGSIDITSETKKIDISIDQDGKGALWASNHVTLVVGANYGEHDILSLSGEVTALTGNVAVTNYGTNQLTVSSNVLAAGTIDLYSGGDIRVGGNGTLTATDIALNAGDGITLSGPVAATHGSVTAIASNFSINIHDHITASDGIILDTGGRVDMSMGGDSSLSAGSNVVINAAFENTFLHGITATNGGIFVTNKGGHLTITNAATISAGGEISMTTVSNLMMRDGTSLSAGGDITLNSGSGGNSDMNLWGVTSTNGGIFVTNQVGDVVLYSNLTAKGDVEVSSGGHLTISNHVASQAGNIALESVG